MMMINGALKNSKSTNTIHIRMLERFAAIKYGKKSNNENSFTKDDVNTTTSQHVSFAQSWFQKMVFVSKALSL